MGEANKTTARNDIGERGATPLFEGVTMPKI